MKKGSKNSIPSEVKKGAWTKEEDDRLTKCIEKYGKVIKWHELPRKTGLNRCRKSCRLRWLNYLRPNIKRGDFDDDEVDLMLRLHKLLGNRWTLIAGRLPGRTPNDVKNYWNTHLHKKLLAAEKQEVAAPPHAPEEEEVEATEVVVLEEPKFPKIRELAKPQPQRFPNKTMENENIILNKKSTTTSDPLLTSIESANYMSSLGPAGPDEENSAGLWPRINIDGEDEFFPELSDIYLSQLDHLDYWELLNLDLQLPLIDYSNDI